MINRPFPKHLEELKLINCKVHSHSLLNLLKSLKERTYLRKLGLVNLNFSELCLPLINDIIINCRNLYELDLSWNDLRPQNVTKILDSL